MFALFIKKSPVKRITVITGVRVNQKRLKYIKKTKTYQKNTYHTVFPRSVLNLLQIYHKYS